MQDKLMDFPMAKEEYISILKKNEAVTQTPSHSLELSLILIFIYMASRRFGILPKDIL
jgi:hypothetical protein